MTSSRAYRLTVWASTVIALAIMGDSLMYSLLPLAAPHLGIALPLVGILLSANRLIRLVTNAPTSVLFARLGPRRPFLLSTLLSLAAVVLYGVAAGFAVFLLARLLWGVAWSGLRQGGYQMIWAGEVGQRGRLMGLEWGVIRLGSAVSVLVGGVLFDAYGYKTAVAVIAVFVALAVPLAWLLPWPVEAARQVADVPREKRERTLKEGTSRWVIASGFTQSLLEAVTISTAAIFLSAHFASGWTLGYVGTATGVLLAVRWMSNLVFGPLLGALADHIGHTRMGGALAVAILVLAVVTLQASGGWGVLALAGMFIGNAGLVVVLTAIANTMALRTLSPHVLIGAFTTAVDAGLALGPLLAYAVLPAFPLAALYVLLSLFLCVTVLRLGWAYSPPQR